MLPEKQRAGGFLHVKLMFLIMCEELIRDARRSTLQDSGSDGTLQPSFPASVQTEGAHNGAHYDPFLIH